MYDVASLIGLGLLTVGGLLVMVTTRRRGTLPEEEVDRRFQDIVGRLGE